MMRSIGAVTSALFRSTVRNRQGLFWTFFFPVFLMLVFSLLGNTSSLKVNLAVAGPPGPATAQIVAAFRRIPLFHVDPLDLARAKTRVREGKDDAALAVPAGARAGGPTKLTLYYNDANYVQGRQAVAAVQSALAGVDVALTGRQPALVAAPQPVSHSVRSTFLDFLVPGIVALMVMQNSLSIAATSLIRWKEKGVLRRFLATPLRPGQLLAGVVVNQLVFNLASVAIVVFIATGVLHARVALPAAPLLAVVVLGIATFLALGFLLAGIARTQEAAVPLINVVTFPMMFLSGVFFPVTSLPAFLQRIVAFFPLTYLADGTRALMSGQAGGAIAGDIAGLAIWLVVCGAVGARTWRWE